MRKTLLITFSALIFGLSTASAVDGMSGATQTETYSKGTQKEKRNNKDNGDTLSAKKNKIKRNKQKIETKTRTDSIKNNS